MNISFFFKRLSFILKARFWDFKISLTKSVLDFRRVKRSG
ncbi:hypothetical protein LEP1GSC137_2602 [Leptospira borgpetersenii str. Noumea 25]|uniref:Uncharacterized protein n=1 Tax=Leptospira borgpetersenii serovar Ballum TaxID=280505 RepID=A0A0S2IVY4_LEPBO|nr:hypothetical protein LBBP_03259 [Leptospira borgpetersenii serovar Ballum]EKQ99538.1 hypothetical protein LEP1GSC121_2044 [Leptospira borgpetersenii serovar Castellonis str. 200801910]EMO09032.1 hypothetical protein LEP1GSC137_2602 [Leptospira borgpetersenii str. Noumea 25]